MYETNTLTAADVAAVTRNNDGNNGMFGNDSWAWIIILLLFGYGGRGFGGGFGFDGFGDLGDIFESFFGGGGGRSRGEIPEARRGARWQGILYAWHLYPRKPRFS